MATERNAGILAEFFKFSQLGSKVAGRVREFKSSDNGPFVVFEPCVIREGRNGTPTRYHSVAVGLTTDLRMKLHTPHDAGKFFALEFREKEPTSKGSDRKLFKVEELSLEEMRELAALAEQSTDGVYRKPTASNALVENGEDDEELPF